MQRIAGILRADQVRERQGHALGRREAVFAVEDHAVAAIEHQHGGAGALVFALVDHQVGIIEFDGHLRAFAADGVEERGADVQIQRVAEFVGAGDAAGFDSGGQFARVVAAEAALAERAEQILQRAESQEVDGLVGDFEARLILRVAPAHLPARHFVGRRGDLRRLSVDVALFHHALDQRSMRSRISLLDLPEPSCVNLLEQIFRQQVAFLEGAQNRLAQSFHRLFGIEFGDAVILRFETALQEEVAEPLDQLLEIDGVGGLRPCISNSGCISRSRSSYRLHRSFR